MEKQAIIYTEHFKKKLIEMIESGKISVELARRKYQIGGKMTISNWRKKYGNCRPLYTRKSFIMKKNKSASTDELAAQVQKLERENSLLKHLLKESEYFKNPVVKKKIALRLSEFLAKNPEMEKNLDLPLKKFVLYSESPVRHITGRKKELSNESKRRQ
jgi:transposase-like protein